MILIMIYFLHLCFIETIQFTLSILSQLRFIQYFWITLQPVEPPLITFFSFITICISLHRSALAVPSEYGSITIGIYLLKTSYLSICQQLQVTLSYFELVIYDYLNFNEAIFERPILALPYTYNIYYLDIKVRFLNWIKLNIRAIQYMVTY